MIYISEQIKEALKTLAEIKRRPPYELCIVKSVLSAYRNDEPHCLKAELDVILERKYPHLKPTQEIVYARAKPELATDEQYQEFLDITASFLGAVKMLACLSGMDQSTLSLLKRRGEIKKSYFEILQPHFAAVLAEKARHLQPKPKAVPKPKIKKPKNNNGQKVMRQIMSASVAEAKAKGGGV